MNILSVMSVLWLLAIAGLVGLMVYRGHLTQHETDQLFLNENETVDFNHAEHDEIVRRVNRLTPICQGVGGAAALITVGIIGVYIVQTLPYVRF